jgi:hypothetical protein
VGRGGHGSEAAIRVMEERQGEDEKP